MNTLTDDTLDRFIHRTVRRQRYRQYLLSFFVLMAVVSLLFSVYVWMTSNVAAVNAWAGLLATVFAVVVASRMWQAAVRERNYFLNMAGSMPAAVDAAIEATRNNIRSHKVMLIGVPAVMLPLFAVSVWQLYLQEKMSAPDVASFAVLLGVVTVVVLVTGVHRVRHELRTRLEKLVTLQKSMG